MPLPGFSESIPCGWEECRQGLAEDGFWAAHRTMLCCGKAATGSACYSGAGLLTRWGPDLREPDKRKWYHGYMTVFRYIFCVLCRICIERRFFTARKENKRPRSGHLFSPERIRNRNESREATVSAKQIVSVSRKRKENKRPRSGHLFSPERIRKGKEI